ncbi:MAG: slipin family protein [Chloroflexi bacterium]|nr:slipin family protein [Chloroflexota bacterium]
MEGTGLIWIGAILLILIVGLFNSIKVVQEYERGVVFRLGRLVGAKGPGLFFIIPVLDRVVKIDLRVVTLEIPTQEVITKDNVSVRVNAVLYFRVYDPAKAVINVTDFIRATLQIAQTTLRSVLGQSELDELLSLRDKINEILQRIIDKQTEPWGIKVSTVEVKDVELPQSMQRAMARQAEAEREKRAKIIHAEGELQASTSLAQAAHVMGTESQSMQLRYLQTLTEIAAEKNSTIIFPLPIDLLSTLMGGFGGNGQRESQRTTNGSATNVKTESKTKLPENVANPILREQEQAKAIPFVDRMESAISGWPGTANSVGDTVLEPEATSPSATDATAINQSLGKKKR